MTQTSSPLAVVAVGGNSLILDEGRRSVPDQYAAAVETCRHIADMLALGWRVVLTHGNGPQVGFILRRSELARHELHEVPLDACGADTQGAIGYMFQRALRNEIERRARAGAWPHPPVSPVTLVTQTLVDMDDPAFQNPSKPIGSFMDAATARARAEQEGWRVVEDAGRGWRRVVPSPRPLRIVELDAIGALVRQGFLVICAGGGGVPVARHADGSLIGLDAVIDKDLASAALAAALQADLFLISTAVEKVALDYNTPRQRWLERMTAGEAQEYARQGHFQRGSMGPKSRPCWSISTGIRAARRSSPTRPISPARCRARPALASPGKGAPPHGTIRSASNTMIQTTPINNVKTASTTPGKDEEVRWEVIAIVGWAEAEVMRSKLDSFHIPCILQREAAGTALGITIGTLGEVRVMVPEQLVQEALDLLNDNDEGEGEGDVDVDVDVDDKV